MVFLAGMANDNHDSKAAVRFLPRGLTERPTMGFSPRFIRRRYQFTAQVRSAKQLSVEISSTAATEKRSRNIAGL